MTFSLLDTRYATQVAYNGLVYEADDKHKCKKVAHGPSYDID